MDEIVATAFVQKWPQQEIVRRLYALQKIESLHVLAENNANLVTL